MLDLGPSSRRQAPIGSESLPVFCDQVRDAKGGILSDECSGAQSFEGLARDVALIQGQPAGKGEGVQRRNRATAGPRFARVVSGRRHRPFRLVIDRLMRPNKELEECHSWSEEL